MASCVVVPLGPACANLFGVRAGDRNLITATVTSAGAPVNLTGYTLTAQARKKRADDINPPLDAVIEVTDAATGAITIRWPGDAVTALLAGKEKWDGVWDLQMDDGAGDPVTVVEGTFGAVMDVTR